MNPLFIFLTSLFLVMLVPEKGKIIVTIEGITKSSGTMIIGLFDNQKEFTVTPVKSVSITVTEKGTMTAELDEVPYKSYAISIYQDINKNGKLDKNAFGQPTEPYGFSNNPKIFMGPPTFEKSSFELKEKELKMKIQLN